MKMETVLEFLQQWGEVMITTDAGQTFELHLGDTEFDFENRLITLRSSKAIYIIAGDSVEVIEQHFGERDYGDD